MSGHTGLKLISYFTQNHLFYTKNLLDSEMYKTFDEKRPPLEPYGMTCELWIPNVMNKPDRHNEIEINFIKDGSLTYLINGQLVEIGEKSLAVFWGLTHHQIVGAGSRHPYFVVTLPLACFLEWELPDGFVNRILRGDIVIEEDATKHLSDAFLFNQWIADINGGSSEEIEAATLEIRARLHRLGIASSRRDEREQPASTIDLSTVDLVNQIAFFIAGNYTQPLKVADIGRAVNLHPDYANSIFKKIFGRTLTQHLLEQRILHARRKLLSTPISISEIAYESGFNSISRFNDAFLKLCGCTPGQYRRGRGPVGARTIH